MNVYSLLRQLAKLNKSQNLFVAAKEINSIRLFKNSFNLSQLQEIYLNYLYIYDIVMRDMITDKISKHVTDNEIYTDAYMLWRKEKKYKEDKESSKKKDLHLIVGKEIKFPKRG
jgi:hypothetical protein